MRMEADHNLNNLNFHNGRVFPPSLSNQNVVSFQPVAIGLVSERMYNSGEISTVAGMILPGNPGTHSHTASVMPLPGNLSGNIILDPMPPVKHSATVATHWSLEELYVLRQGLTEYATEPINIMKYIKIAAKLPEKTVRDVAMKCQLMVEHSLKHNEESGKRRRLENYHAEKKEKIVYTSSLSTVHTLQTESVATFSLRVHDVPSNNQLCQASPINFETQRLLMENFNLLNQIGSNLELSKVQDNINLFYRARENTTNILTSMSVDPGIMSQMPSLPVLIDDHLLQSVLPLANQVHLPATTSLKEEPRYW